MTLEELPDRDGSAAWAESAIAHGGLMGEYRTLALNYLAARQRIVDLMNLPGIFVADAAAKQADYEAGRREHRRLYPTVTRDELEAAGVDTR
jgi:hypothetical protein